MQLVATCEASEEPGVGGGIAADGVEGVSQPPADPDLRALFARAAEGEQQATEKLVGHLHDGIFRLALAITNAPADAEEVVQETFLNIFRGKATFAGRSQVTTWVHRIAVNTALMRVRARQRRPWDHVATYGHVWERGAPTGEPEDASRALGGVSMGAAEAWAARPDAGALDGEVRAQIDHAVRALPERYRLVFVLHEVEGHANEVVAEMLGLTVPTVKARLVRARQAMRRALGPLLGRGRGGRG